MWLHRISINKQIKKHKIPTNKNEINDFRVVLLLAIKLVLSGRCKSFIDNFIIIDSLVIYNILLFIKRLQSMNKDITYLIYGTCYRE